MLRLSTVLRHIEPYLDDVPEPQGNMAHDCNIVNAVWIFQHISGTSFDVNIGDNHVKSIRIDNDTTLNEMILQIEKVLGGKSDERKD